MENERFTRSYQRQRFDPQSIVAVSKIPPGIKMGDRDCLEKVL